MLRALRPFTSHPEVAQVVLVLPPSDAAQPPDFLSELRSARGAWLSLSLPAGSHRGDSVRNGLAQLGDSCAVVLVHDGARPFVDRDVIDGGHHVCPARTGCGRRGAAQRHPEGSVAP